MCKPSQISCSKQVDLLGIMHSTAIWAWGEDEEAMDIEYLKLSSENFFHDLRSVQIYVRSPCFDFQCYNCMADRVLECRNDVSNIEEG